VIDAILPDIGKALIGLGPGGIVAFIFWRQWQAEREERRELQKMLIDLGKESMAGDIKVADALQSIRQEIAAARSK
jgi:hypothetical protein